MTEYHLHFDPISNSLFIAAGITATLAVIGGFFGLWMMKSWKPSEQEDSELVGGCKIAYVIAYSIVMLFCLLFTSCQTTGCSDSGNYRLISQQQYHQQLQAENKVLKAKLELLKANGVDPDSYDIPLPEESKEE
jgi:hypothetical protein